MSAGGDFSAEDGPACQSLHQLHCAEFVEFVVASELLGQGLLDEHGPSLPFVRNEQRLVAVGYEGQVGIHADAAAAILGVEGGREIPAFGFVVLDYFSDLPWMLA